jgi:hypothetical protein
MDYTATEDQTEDPWATSPQPTRTSFEAPDSPAHAPNTAEQHTVPHFGQDSHDETPHEEEVPQSPGNAAPARPIENAPKQLPTQKRKDKPKYKLQAKITSLERQGRKDPILKFDVYVRVVRD